MVEVSCPSRPADSRVVLILEDDPNRIARFRVVLRGIDPGLRIMIWHSATRMIREVTPCLGDACLVSLDHDLSPTAGDAEDPGDGLDLAKHLAPLRPRCPVILHSSNADRVPMMAGEFELEGWSYRTVSPFPDDWVETHWARVVRQLLNLP